MMFGLIPFERNDNNIFDLFDNFQKQFFRNSNATLPAFRADIRDLGDKFVLEAELPGFNKEDISLDLKEGILTVKASTRKSRSSRSRASISAGSAGAVPLPGASMSPASTRAASPPPIETGS